VADVLDRYLGPAERRQLEPSARTIPTASATHSPEALPREWHEYKAYSAPEMNREIKRLVILRRKNGHVTGRYAHLDIDFDGGGT
jgi:hypothetical protein